jgi:hypothetical protein
MLTYWRTLRSVLKNHLYATHHNGFHGPSG